MVTGLPIANACRVLRMASGRSLTTEENAKVLEAVREILDQPGMNQTVLAPKIGLKQPTLSAWLGNKHQAGYATARRVAELLGVHVDVLLGYESEREDVDSQVVGDRTAIGSHREFEASFSEFWRRLGDSGDYDQDIKKPVSTVSFGGGVPEFIDWRLIKSLADAEMQARRIRREREAERARNEKKPEE